MGDRGRRQTPSSSTGNTRSGRRGNSRGRWPRGPPLAVNDRRGDRVWGFTPHAGVDQSSMTRLFEMQNRLKADLRRQAKLAKLAVTEVRSTQAEQLRRVNEAMLHASSLQVGVENPFSHRDLIDAQIISEDMIKRSGRKVIEGASVAKPTRPSKFLIKKHRRDKTCDSEVTVPRLSPSDCFSLRGALLRDFSRAKARGYSGPPHRWLRGPGAEAAWSRLRRKFANLPHPTEYGIFDSRSPLHWRMNSHTPVAHNLRHGFRGERLHVKDTNFVVLRRQAASVKRLKLSDWPKSDLGRSWPTYPTLNESWELTVRGKFPHGQYTAPPTNVISPVKRPLRLVKPGSAARVVSKNVLGIRADTEVPRKFLAYFHYRWGFLILQRKFSLPKELVKFLVETWKRDFTRMFLVSPIRFSAALKHMPDTAHWAMSGFLRGGAQRSVAPKDGRQRHRPPRRDRDLAKSLGSSYDAGNTSKEAPSSSDRSDSGVRLY